MDPWKGFWDLLGVGVDPWTTLENHWAKLCISWGQRPLPWFSFSYSLGPGEIFFALNPQMYLTNSNFPYKIPGKGTIRRNRTELPLPGCFCPSLVIVIMPFISHKSFDSAAIEVPSTLFTVSGDIVDWWQTKIRYLERNIPFLVQWILGSLGGCWEKEARIVS